MQSRTATGPVFPTLPVREKYFVISCFTRLIRSISLADTFKLSSQPTMSLKSSGSPRQRWVLEAVESPTISTSTGKQHHRHLSNDLSVRNLTEPPKEGPVLGEHSESANTTQSHSRKHVQLAQQLAQAHQYQDLLASNGEEDLDNQSSGDNSGSNSPMIYCQPSSSSNTGKFSSRFSSGVVAPAPAEALLPRSISGGGETNRSSSLQQTHTRTHTRSESRSSAVSPLPESSSKLSARSSSVKIPTPGIKSRLAAVITSELEDRLDR